MRTAALVVICVLGPNSAFADGPSCADFLQAAQAGNEGSYLDYIMQIEQQLDEADTARGCQSAMYSINPKGERQSLDAFVYRMCGASPSQTLYSMAQAVYGMRRATAKMGLGDGCR